MKVYTRRGWEQLTSEERRLILRESREASKKVWDIGYGCIAFATPTEMAHRTPVVLDWPVELPRCRCCLLPFL